MNDNIIEQAEIFTTEKVNREFSDRLVYHDIHAIHRIVEAVKQIGSAENLTDEQMEYTTLAAWLVKLGLTHLDNFKHDPNPQAFYAECSKCSKAIAGQFLEANKYPKEKTEKVLSIISAGFRGGNPEDITHKVFADAVTIDYAISGSKRHVKKLYEEYVLIGAMEGGKVAWFEKVISYLRGHEYLTTYGKEKLAPQKLSLIAKLGKEQKAIKKTQDQIITKELNISDEELKKLKKNLTSVKGRDDRGIQTMFRTVSRNHYTLTQMVDRKANIMISINAILLSLIIGKLLTIDERLCIHNAPMLTMLLASLVSIFFAVIAIRPSKTHGSFTEEEVRNKQGNLLFFGNFHDMTFRDYHWGMMQMMHDSEHMYTTMVRDLYYLGQKLNTKSKFIRKSLNIFLVGFVLSVVLFLILTPLVGSHF